MNHLLIVDDSATVRAHLVGVLTRAGYEVATVAGGQAALADYQKQPASLVVLDVVMPEMDGIETYRALCKLDPQVKVLAISGQGPRFAGDYLKILLAMGADAVLEKPFPAEQLLTEVRRLLQEQPSTHPARAQFRPTAEAAKPAALIATAHSSRGGALPM